MKFLVDRTLVQFSTIAFTPRKSPFIMSNPYGISLRKVAFLRNGCPPAILVKLEPRMRSSKAPFLPPPPLPRFLSSMDTGRCNVYWNTAKRKEKPFILSSTFSKTRVIFVEARFVTRQNFFSAKNAVNPLDRKMKDWPTVRSLRCGGLSPPQVPFPIGIPNCSYARVPRRQSFSIIARSWPEKHR